MASCAIVLAAGQSRRFGRDKRKQPWHNGNTLLSQTLSLYQQQCTLVYVVMRPDDESLAQTLELENNASFSIVYAEQAELGMGHSLSSGAAALVRDSAAKTYAHFFVGLADMPYVKPQTLETLLSRASTANGTILQPTYQGQPGNPVLFAMEHAPALTRLQGDQGARAFIRQHAQQRQLIEVDDPGVLHDIDKPSDITEEPLPG